jgi:hypothetical protein
MSPVNRDNFISSFPVYYFLALLHQLELPSLCMRIDVPPCSHS